MDQIKQNEMMVKYCPTEEMLGDNFMKPLQGALFHKFQNQIINHVTKNHDPKPLMAQDHRSMLGQQMKSYVTNLDLQSHPGDD